MSVRRDDILAKVLSRVIVDPVTKCWNWQGPDSGDGRGGGYGRMNLDGATVAVHRVIYCHFFGYIPPKKQIDHKCNNRRCCSPFHLRLRTHKQNQKLRDQRGEAEIIHKIAMAGFGIPQPGEQKVVGRGPEKTANIALREFKKLPNITLKGRFAAQLDQHEPGERVEVDGKTYIIWERQLDPELKVTLCQAPFAQLGVG